MRKINLGCGPYKKSGYINFDLNPLHKPDVCRDVRKGLPFDDDSVHEIFASHFLEHLAHDEMLDLLEEAFRVLVPNGRVCVAVPLREPYSIDHILTFEKWSFDPIVNELSAENAKHYQKKFLWRMENKKVLAPEPVKGIQIMKFDLVALK